MSGYDKLVIVTAAMVALLRDLTGKHEKGFEGPWDFAGR